MTKIPMPPGTVVAIGHNVYVRGDHVWYVAGAAVKFTDEQVQGYAAARKTTVLR